MTDLRRDMEARRLQAYPLIAQGVGCTAIAAMLHVARNSVSRWRQSVRAAGEKGLLCRRTPGRPRRLTHGQRAEMAAIYREAQTVWTTQRFADEISTHFGVRYHADYAGKMMHELGLPVRPSGRGKARAV